MMRNAICVLATIFVFTGISFAAKGLSVDRPTEIRALEVEKRVDGMRMVVELPEPQTVEINTGDVQGLVMEIPGAGMLEEAGRPPVPVSSQFFRIPPTGGVEVEIVTAEYEVLSGADYLAWLDENNGEAILGELNPVDEWYPATIAEVGDPAIFRDFRVANLITYPVQVNAALNEVRIYSTLDVDIHYTPSGINELDSNPTAISKTYLPVYQSFLDWDDGELDEFELYRGAVQVVVKETALPVLQPWIDWKLQKGWELDFITDDGMAWSSSNIKAELQNRWDTYEHKFDWVVVIGDVGGSYPTPAGSGYGDHYYVKLDGNDELPEAGIGRISVETPSQLGTYVNKVLEYESEPYMDETGWYKRGMVAAGSNSSGMSTVHLGRYARHRMLDIGYTEVDTAWYYSQNNVNSISIQKINAGVSLYNYRGWLGTGIDNNEISNLTNYHKLPMVFDITCGTGTWTSGTGHNEAYIRAGTATNPTGGIGAIATATSGTHTRYNNSLEGGALYAMLAHRLPEMGHTIFWSKLILYRSFNPWAATYVHSFAEWANLMGDPTVWLWTDIPQPLEVTHEPEIDQGRHGFEVTVRDADGVAVPGAWVCLYKGDEEEQVVVETDSNGQVTLETPFDLVGNAKLTVTKQNFHPYQVDVPVVDSEIIAVNNVQYIDSGFLGTSGDGDGVPEPGEIVGMRFMLQNHMSVAREGIMVTYESDDPMIEEIRGFASVSDMQPGQIGRTSTMILVSIRADAQNDWNVHGQLNIGSRSIDGIHPNEQSDILSFKIRAPEYTEVMHTINPDLNPGGSANVTVTVRNIGLSDGQSGQMRLVSLDPYLNINSNWIGFNGLAMGAETDAGPFSVTAHPASFRGYPAKAFVEIVADNGHVDSVYTTIRLGEPTATDPVGPDDYGYIAFDDRDTEYDLAPVFDWVEISTDAGTYDYPGTDLNMNDYGEETEVAELIDLPFPIQMYGETFDQMTITSNGMISMGDQTDMAVACNWPIPAPLGPSYMVAPYWDDRITTTGGVYYYYDAGNDRLIVEWYNVDAYGSTGNQNTFQVIFYDQIGEHMTQSGDTNMLFQYEDVSHSTGPSWDNDYFTTGIENGDQTVGLQIAYWNAPSNEVTSGRAILITTQAQLITGRIGGTVTYATGGDPVVGASVHTADGAFSATTNQNGQYLMQDVVIGMHDVIVEMQGVNPQTFEDVVVEEDELTIVNAQMTAPGWSLNVDEVNVTLPPGSQVSEDLIITNTGDGDLTFDVDIDFQGPSQTAELDEQWDMLASYPAGPAVTELRNRGVTYYKHHIWLSGANGFANPNKLYRLSPDGEPLQEYNQPVPSPSGLGMKALTTDGQYLYGVDNGVLYEMLYDEVTHDVTVNSTLELPDAAPDRPDLLAYDPEHDVFWIGNTDATLYGVTRAGSVGSTITLDVSMKAIAWYPEDPDGKKLYFYLQESYYLDITVMKLNVVTSATQFVTTIPSNVHAVTDAYITNQWDPMVWGMIMMMDGSAQPDIIEVYEISPYREWMTLGTTSGTIQPGNSFTTQLQLSSLDLPEGTYSNWLRFETNTLEGQIFVPVTLTVDPNGFQVAAGEQVGIPLEWEFNGVYPNPFNPTATISFTMKQTAPARAVLYNVLGQQVAEVLDRTLTTGRHEVMINGNNLASGVYFLHFEAGPMRATRKVVLLR